MAAESKRLQRKSDIRKQKSLEEKKALQATRRETGESTDKRHWLDVCWDEISGAPVPLTILGFVLLAQCGGSSSSSSGVSSTSSFSDYSSTPSTRSSGRPAIGTTKTLEDYGADYMRTHGYTGDVDLAPANLKIDAAVFALEQVNASKK